MKLHQQMLRKTQLAKLLLRDATANVHDFLRSQLSTHGGFTDRSGASDLYYTVFGIDGLLALGEELPREQLINYVRGIASDELDLIHLTCLIRCACTLDADEFIQRESQRWCASLESYAAADGAYNQNKGAAHGSAYACFIVMDAYQCLDQAIPRPQQMIDCVRAVYCGDGSFSLLPQETTGTTPTTCAALLALRQFGETLPAESQQWLRARASAAGGFVAGPMTPMPDLLSTATALHALSLFEDDCADINERCQDFIDSLWSSQGSFFAYWDDDALDCEYTFYGLLALGHLSAGGQ